MKNQYRGGLPKTGGLGQFIDLRGGLERKRGVFLRGEVDNPMHTMNMLRLENSKWITEPEFRHRSFFNVFDNVRLRAVYITALIKV